MLAVISWVGNVAVLVFLVFFVEENHWFLNVRRASALHRTKQKKSKKIQQSKKHQFSSDVSRSIEQRTTKLERRSSMSRSCWLWSLFNRSAWQNKAAFAEKRNAQALLLALPLYSFFKFSQGSQAEGERWKLTNSPLLGCLRDPGRFCQLSWCDAPEHLQWTWWGWIARLQPLGKDTKNQVFLCTKYLFL